MPPPPAPTSSTPTPASVRGSMRVHPLPPGLTHAANGGGTAPIPDPFAAPDRPASAGSTGSGARLTRPVPSAPLPPPPPAAGRIAPGLGSLGAFHVRADVPARFSSGGVAGAATMGGQQQPARHAGSVVSVPAAVTTAAVPTARPHAADPHSPTAPGPVVDAGDATDAASHARILATLLAQQPPSVGPGSATASATALLAPLSSAPDTRVNLTGAPSDRRASFFFNNVYVPLGIRKLNAMMAPAGGGGGEMGNTSGGLSRSSANSSGADLVGGAGGAGEEKGFLSFKLPPNFGSHVQLFAQLPSTDQKSLVVRKKEIYAQLSLIFGVLLIAFVVTDYVSLLVYLRVSVLRPWLMSIQILHVAAFYLFLLSFIYANEAGDLATLKKALGAFVVNLGAFLGRMVFDIQFDGYMPSSTT
ncbi:hypothetical protein AMAG_11908 [Allomyces macrogynus ATCC 38327]|uniref:Uncharacterized protein n=1 Tax=Allomyces macrogynus (strain ATCC 38327) TaxID=578462 RepID=A0A0L0SY59_ALLM3|nr:hypothetical protein AMAG_11908 [Allomyces macrogynus ATCC 38327]|eukprot:KNE67446.1 hypothetical protein AMAG_11908 [Allomyces macrogynus ATCC 38327]